MRTKTLILSALLLTILLVACRRDQEEPTPTSPPATAVAADTPTAEPEPTETATPRPTATPTAEPQAAAIDPEEIDWPPQIVSRTPASGEEASLDGAITIRFDQPMDQESVQSAFQIQAVDGEQTVEGSFQWPRADTVVFTPQARLGRNQRYQVQLDTVARGRNGQNLPHPLDIFFQTAGYLEIAQVIPADGTDNVSTEATITVFFNRPVVPLVSTGQQADLPQPLTIEPAVEGSGEWVSTSVYRFTPDEPLAGATEYSATIAAGLEDVMGGVLASDYSWSFTTQRPSVATIVPENGAGDVNPTHPLTVTFNMPMDRASVESAISLEPVHPVTFDWSEDGRTVILEPETMLDLGTTYTLNVNDSATAATGLASLDRETSSSFTTVPLPAVTRTTPSRGQEVPFFQYGVQIEFASPMDPDTIRGRIEITPAPEDDPDYIIRDRFVNVNFELERETEYTVTIPADVADPYGNTLGADYTWSFTTAPPPPVASLNLPSNVSQVSESHPTTVDVVYRSVDTVNAELYQLGLPVSLLLEPFRVHDSLPGSQPVRTWSLDTEVNGSARALSLDLAGSGETLPLGTYYLAVDSPAIGEDVRYWQNQRHLLVVADTNLVVKEMFGAVHVWATDLETGEPASGRTLRLYNANGVQEGTATTDADGFASFPYETDLDYLEGVLVVSGSPGQPGFGVANSRWNPGVSPWQFDVPATSNRELPEFAYLYTDRPIYRPGDTVRYRGILRDANYARYGLPERDEVTVRAEFFSFFEPSEELDYAVTLPVDANGTFNGTFTIPDDARLGEYRLYLEERGDIGNPSRSFTVAEYRAPEFIVTTTPEEEEALRGDTVDVVVEARYFFGAPAPDLAVNWAVRERAYRFPWDGPHYSFDADDAYYFSYDQQENFFGNLLREGTGRTDADGRLVITLPADLLEEAEGGSRLVTVEATVRDISEFPVTATGQVAFHAAEAYVGVSPQTYLNQAGEETAVDLITVDWDGNPAPNRDVDVVFYRREYRYVEDTEFGNTFGRWEPEDTEVARVETTTDADGEAQAAFTPEDGGTYRALATVTDDAGRTQTSSTLFWVSDSDYVAWRVNPEEKRMDLTPDQRTYEVGDTARILVQSPFEGPVNAWLTIERGDLIEQRLITLQSNSETVEIPVTEALSPNAFVTIVAVKGVDETNQYADVRLGLTELVVPPDPFTLNVELSPRDDVLAPGETVTYDIRVTRTTGEPVQADLSLSLVDLAVLTLKEDNAPPIANAFYDRQPYRSEVGSGLFVSGEGLDVEVPQEVLGRGGGGGGEAAALDAPAVQEEEDDGIRRDFPDTAFWRANVVTDENGEATVEIPLPDNVTTWRLSAKAVTVDTLVGQTSVDVVATLPLLLRPVTPRFFTVNDTVQLGAIVNNNSDQSLDVTVSLEAEGLTMLGEAEQNVTVAAGRQQLVRWPVQVEDVQFADLTFRASGGDFSDATKPTFGVGPDQLIPVYRYDAQDIVGTSGVLEEPGRQVEAVLLPPEINTRHGSVDVSLSPSLAAAVLEALDAVNDPTFTPACAHSIASRLLPNAATARTISELNLDEPGLASELNRLIPGQIDQIEGLAKPGGGWGWCYAQDRDPLLTAYIIFTLVKADEAGYSVDDDILRSAIGYLASQLEEDVADLTNAHEVNRQAYFLYVLAQAGEEMPAFIEELFADHRELLDPYATAFLALAYEPFAGNTDLQDQAFSDLSNSAVASATGTHWEDSTDDWRNLSSDIFNTAVVLDALSRLDPGNPLAPGAVRWLMSARTASHWSTPYETAWTLLSLTDWMATTGELDADYDYLLNVNGRNLERGAFTEENVTESVESSVPVGRLLPDDVNFLIFEHGDGPGRLYYTAHLNAFIDAEAVEPVSRGITVQRTYYDAACDPEEETCEPIDVIEAGQRVRVELTVVAPNDLTYTRVEDPIPAGAEAVDPGLETSASGLAGEIQRTDRDYRYGYWGWWRFDEIEYRDDRVVFYSNFLPAGTYQYTYFLETSIPGDFQVRPAVAYQEFFPEVFGRSAGMLFTIAE
ncbi:MAG: Ig-like domain-containing protein [Candidatus Promineifilaceae bacterium]|nr:Ig-like domain-containing protein [Candidatus Promineifilaceae bacterium]